MQTVVKSATSKFVTGLGGGGLGPSGGSGTVQRMLSVGRNSMMSIGSQTSRRRRMPARSP